MMKHAVRIFSIVLVFFMPLQAISQERKNYFSIKPGIYTFTGGLKEASFATGFKGEIAYGRYLHPNVILEIETGYFHDGVNKGYGNSIKGKPILLTFKAAYPLGNLELLAGAGLGLYFTKFSGKVNGVIGDESYNVFGGHVVAGAQYAFSRLFFFGIEGKYVTTETARFNVFSPSLNGYAIAGNFGFRF